MEAILLPDLSYPPSRKMKEDTILLYFAVQSEKNTRYPPSLLNPIITLEQEAQISEDREGG